MITLGIETTCDEMAVAVVKDGIEILSNVVASQSSYHRHFGGVYPEMAARKHVDLLIPTIEEALQGAKIHRDAIDLIGVAKGPGLIGSLMIGLNAAKALALGWNKPFIGVNHVEAHLYAAMMSNHSFLFPAIGVVVSGGHTFIVKILDVGHYEMIGSTVDDAVGEAFDKVASMLNLPYPGGPEIEKLASQGDSKRYPFKAGVVKGRPWDFSFSGLKTNVLYTLKGQNGAKSGNLVVPEDEKKHIAASFQRAALLDIAKKALLAAKEFGAKAIYVGGGVSCNKLLRELLKSDIPVLWPEVALCQDNGAMIAGLATHLYSGEGDSFSLEASVRIPL